MEPGAAELAATGLATFGPEHVDLHVQSCGSASVTIALIDPRPPLEQPDPADPGRRRHDRRQGNQEEEVMSLKVCYG